MVVHGLEKHISHGRGCGLACGRGFAKKNENEMDTGCVAFLVEATELMQRTPSAPEE